MCDKLYSNIGEYQGGTIKLTKKVPGRLLQSIKDASIDYLHCLPYIFLTTHHKGKSVFSGQVNMTVL